MIQPPVTHYSVVVVSDEGVQSYNTSADIKSVLVPIKIKQRYFISVESWNAVGKNSNDVLKEIGKL